MTPETLADTRLRQAHRFNATPRQYFHRFASKYRARCIGCNRDISPGDSIMWSKDCGACCLECFGDLKGGSM